MLTTLLTCSASIRRVAAELRAGRLGLRGPVGSPRRRGLARPARRLSSAVLIAAFLSCGWGVARAGETRLPSGVEVHVDLAEDDGWREESAHAPVVQRYVHESSGTVVQVYLVRMPVDADGVPLDAGANAVVDWDERFRLDDPRVEVLDHGEIVLAEVRGRFGLLRFEGRVGWYFGFSEAAAAAAVGEPGEPDGAAVFVLCEEESDAAVMPPACARVRDALTITP